MEHVIFVDDEPLILEGLKRTFRRMRREWDMRFANGGKQALEMLSASPASIVVSDMKMPGMDGADLLAEVKRLSPDTIRVILSGHSEMDLIMKAVATTHQYLAKPCDPDELEELINRTQALRKLVNSPDLARLVAQVDSLPSFPRVYENVIACLKKPKTTLKEVCQILETDIAMTAKIMKLVNSAYFGLAKPVSSIETAVSFLGLETIMSLVLAHSVFKQYDGSSIGPFNVEELFNYTMKVGLAAKVIARYENLANNIVDDAYTSAMLHDCGKLVLAFGVSDAFGKVIEKTGGLHIFSERIERELLGATHAEVGAYLLGLWGLPDVIIDAVAHHETPSKSVVRSFGALGVVHVASRIVLNPDTEDLTAVSPNLDLDYLESLNFTDHWVEWQNIWRKSQEKES